MQDFDYQLRPRIVFGEQSIERLGALALELKAERVLLVSDPGVVAAGLFQRGKESLERSGLHVAGFHDFSENPTTLHVETGREFAKGFQPNLIVGLGGGSSMDCAKGINFLYSCGGRMQDYWGIGKATASMLPMIAVPTTAGTGSETQSFALISDAETHVKMACGDPRAACRVALLDPALTLTQPFRVTALTGIDAITHSLETFVCTKRNPMSECFSMEAWERLSSGFTRVLLNPSDVAARSEMQLGACFAGMAIEASMLGGAHALANPLTAVLGIAHGQAVGMMMPHIVRFNGPVVGDRYTHLLRLTSDANSSDRESSDQLQEVLTDWLMQANLATRLRQLDGWPTEHEQEVSLLEQLTLSATKQWTGAFNPRPLTPNDFADLYRSAL